MTNFKGVSVVVGDQRPGGWLAMPAFSVAGGELQPALARLRNVLWGGDTRLPEQVAETARGLGFTAVQIVPAAVDGTLRAIVTSGPRE
jgi:hypothetical protein